METKSINIKTARDEFRNTGLIFFPLEDSPFSEEEWILMKNQIPIELSLYEHVETGDTDEPTFVSVLRLLNEGNPPNVANPSIAKKLLKIFGSKEKIAFYEQILGENDLMIRRAQVNFMSKGGYIGYHRDSDSSTHYIAAIILLFEAAVDGGKFVVYSKNESPAEFGYFTMLITHADLPHQVTEVREGQRRSLVFWLSKKE